MNEYSFVGKPIPRPDSPDKVAGKAIYIHDLKRPGMLYGKIKYSDFPHARILNIDTSKAERLPGVRAVITAYNTPEVRFGFIRDNMALKKDKVRQYRDEVAAVAATDPEIAEEAIDLIKVEYEELPGVFDPEEAMKEGAPIIHEVDGRGRPRKDNLVPVPWRFVAGDLQAAMGKARYIAEDNLSTPPILHACLGTSGCIAEFDLQNNLIMYTKTQIPFLAQNDFNRALAAMGLKGKNTRVIVPTLGGSFGSGLDTHGYEYIAILLAYKTGRPVKIVLTREEESRTLSPRQPSRTRIVQGCDEKGRLLFREVRMLLDNGAYTSWGATTPSVMMLPISSIYRVPNVFYEAKLVYTNNTYCQAMRGYGNPQAAWAIETNLDHLAEEAGIDPLEMRLINKNIPNDISPMGLHITTCGMEECLKAVSEKLHWEQKRGKGRQKARGVGLACLFHVGGSGRVYRSDGTGVVLKIDDFGYVTVVTGAIEMGQGLCGALTVATAEALGVTPDRVMVVTGDTATCPWDVGTHASRGAFTACNAVIMAAQKARAKVFELASEHFLSRVKYRLEQMKRKDPSFELPDLGINKQLGPEDFDLRENYLVLKSSPNDKYLRVSLDEIIREAHFKEQGTMIITEAFYDPCNQMIDMKTCRGNLSVTYIFGAQGAEVEVDRETGEVKILRYVAAHDVGKVINRHTILGQIFGGGVQGLGYALCEEYKAVKGKMQNPNFLDYKILSANDLNFPFEVELVETLDQGGPFGAKGVGEPGLVAVAPAIANAIYDAIGIRINSLPLSREKIALALRDKKTT